jgi:hypothetical protein
MKRKWKMIFKGKIEDFDPSISLDYWKNRSTEEKFIEVDKLIKQALEIKGKTSNGQKFLRTTAIIKRA